MSTHNPVLMSSGASLSAAGASRVSSWTVDVGSSVYRMDGLPNSTGVINVSMCNCGALAVETSPPAARNFLLCGQNETLTCLVGLYGVYTKTLYKPIVGICVICIKYGTMSHA